MGELRNILFVIALLGSSALGTWAGIRLAFWHNTRRGR